jgi:hypothetical protein
VAGFVPLMGLRNEALLAWQAVFGF